MLIDVNPTTCAQCGASIDPLALACPFCKRTTPAGVADRQRYEHAAAAQASYEAYARQQQFVAAQTMLASTSTQSLVGALMSFAVCCLPVSVFAIVQGVRARGMAAKLGVPVPSKAVAGLVLGIVASLTSTSIYVWSGITAQQDKEESEVRIAVLEKQIGPRAGSPVLERSVACGLAEIHARRTGWDGKSGPSLHTYVCDGRLERTSETSVDLEDFRFSFGSTAHPYDVHVCFVRGAKWYVKKMQEERCTP